MAARSLAVMHTTMYNAWAAYSPVAVQTPHGPRVRRPESEQVADNKAMAMSHAAYRVLLDQFPTQKALFDSYMTGLGYDLASQTDLASPQGIGQALAAAMLDYCHKDGSNQLGNLTPSGVPYADYTGYVPKNPALAVAQPTPLAAVPAPGNWQPLTYTDASGATVTPGYLAACWGRMTPFALASADQYRPGPPAAPGTPEYAAQVQHIVDVQAGLTERQKVIAEYWADGPKSELPPGHWCLLAQSVSTRDGNTDDQDVLLFFALANALSDAAIAAWDAKRAYDSERPITAVRYRIAPDRGRDVDPVPARHVSDAALPRTRVRPQHVQRGRGGSAAALHRQRRVWQQLHETGAFDGPRTRPAVQRRAAELGDVQRRGGRGRPVARVWRDPLR
jgi:hypothetical protein